MVLEAWLNSLITNYTWQGDLYEQILLLSRKQEALLNSENGRCNIEAIKKILEQRRECFAILEKHNRENQALQSKINKILGIKEFNLSNLAGRVNINTYNRLRAQLAIITEKLKLISQIDAANQKLLQEFISHTQVIESEQNQTKKAIKAYQQASQQKI